MKKTKPYFMLVIYFFSVVIPIFSVVVRALLPHVLHTTFSEPALIGIEYTLLFCITMSLYGKDVWDSFAYLKQKPFKKIFFVPAGYPKHTITQKATIDWIYRETEQRIFF